MQKPPPKGAINNRILSRLSRADYALLRSHLQPVDLPLRRALETKNRRVESVYFIECGFASVVADGVGKMKIEVGLIGLEGMSGISLVLGSDDRAANDTYMQMPVQGLVIKAADLRKAISSSTSLHKAMLLYVHCFVQQTTRTAVANGRSKVEERLARWLLLASDRVDGPLTLTHEFLAMMLAVHRPQVTGALKPLEREGLIWIHRGAIDIIDRKGLVARANGAYAPAESG